MHVRLIRYSCLPLAINLYFSLNLCPSFCSTSIINQRTEMFLAHLQFSCIVYGALQLSVVITIYDCLQQIHKSQYQRGL